MSPPRTSQVRLVMTGWVTLIFLWLKVTPVPVSAQNFSVLKTFNPNINATGIHAHGTLAQGPDSTLYGVTTDGGAGAAGVVFAVQTNGTGFTVLKNFPLIDATTGTNSDGATPQASLLLSGGVLYGTTTKGGVFGAGTVFSVGTNGSSFAVLKHFPALDPGTGTNAGGANPQAALILSGASLYGTTAYGGNGGAGTVFRVNTNGAGFTNLYSFSNGNDGGYPLAGLVLSGATLFGTTSTDGINGTGGIFKIQTNGLNFAVVRAFVAADPDTGTNTDGYNAQASLVLSGNMLYGTAMNGGIANDGTVFRLNTNGGSFLNLHSFTGNDGFNPIAELLLSGATLYGTAANGGFLGGSSSFYGTLFKINTNGTGFATVHDLTGNDGWGPQGGLLLSGGTLIGTTAGGGILPGFIYGNGTLFSFPTNGVTATDLCVFALISGGADPQTGLALSSNVLYGTTLNGGTNNNGALFRLNTNGSGYAEFKDFSLTGSGGQNNDGQNPRGALVLAGGSFYGTTRYGGTAGQGALFKLNADGSGFTNIYSFNHPNPDYPIAALVVSGTSIYGATAGGGSAGFGSVFRINTDGSAFTNLHSFTGGDGSLPTAGLTLSGSALYGVAQGGGSGGNGTIFRLNTDGTLFTNLHSFGPTSFNTNSEGINPGGVLVVSNNVLYGTAFHGGSAGQGTVFKMNADSTGFAVLHHFTGGSSSGAGPGDLLLSGTTLYGAGFYGGTSDKGAIFKLDTTGGGYTVLKSFFGGSDGSSPNSTLVLLSNTLYGTTFTGGLSGHGTVFSLVLSLVSPIPLNIKSIGASVVLTWSDPAFALQASPIVTGTYTNVPGAISPYTNAITGAARFFRLQSN